MSITESPPSPRPEQSMRWLDSIACEDIDPDEFFVDAGKAIKPETRAVCQRCPVRESCCIHAYTRHILNGYFAGLSPSQRRSMSLEQALAFIRKDRAPESIPAPLGIVAAGV